MLPEKVTDPEANRVRRSNRFTANDTEVRWLHAQLTAIITIMERRAGRSPARRSPEVRLREVRVRAACPTTRDERVDVRRAGR